MFIYYGNTVNGTRKYWWGSFFDYKFVEKIIYNKSMLLNDCVWIVPGTYVEE